MRKSRLVCLLVNLAAVALLLAGAELAYRQYVGGRTVFEASPCFQYDPRLGWKLKAGEFDNGGWQSFNSPEGFRGWRRPELPDRGMIVAVGDSCTYCSNVSDEDTWPELLSRRLNVPVLNAGVSGYGVDQIFLRLNEILEEVTPETVIFGIFCGDIFRCEQSRRNHEKPYFAIENGGLILKNSPVPPPGRAGIDRRLPIRSRLLTDLVNLIGGGDVERLKVEHDRGMAVTEKLLEKSAALCRRKGVKLLVVILPGYPDGERKVIRRTRSGRRETLGSASELAGQLQAFCRGRGIDCLNLVGLLQRRFPRSEERAPLFADHLTPAGNRWVAEEIVLKLKSREAESRETLLY